MSNKRVIYGNYYELQVIHNRNNLGCKNDNGDILTM
jgi:hypothetical protein